MDAYSLLLRIMDLRRTAPAVLLSLIAGLAGAATMVLIGRMLVQQDAVQPLQWVGVALAVCAGLALDFVSKNGLIELAAHAAVVVRMRVAQRVLELPYQQFEKRGATAFASVLIDDPRVLGNVLFNLPLIIVGIVKIVGCGLYLVYLSPLVACILALLAALIAGVYQWIQRRAYAQMRLWLRLRETENTALFTLLDGVREFSLNARRRWVFYDRMLRPAVDESVQGLRRTRLRYQTVNAFMQSSQMVVVLALIAIAAFGLLDRRQVAEYTVVIIYMAASATAIVSTLPSLGEANAVAARLCEFDVDPIRAEVELPHAVDSLLSGDSAAPFTIELRGAGYEHQPVGEDPFTLGPVDLKLRSGEIVFLVGGNGSGKTTLVMALVGLYELARGEILVNGRHVEDKQRAAYREMFAVTFAEAFVLRTLKGFVSTMQDDAPALDVRAQQLLERLRLQNKVTVKDGVLSSVELSTGQRKRLALLGAYLEDRPAYVFDEWAASQDPEFRDLFYRQLLPELRARGKLVVVISHDDACFDVADRVVRLDYGRIVRVEKRDAGIA